MLRFLTFVLAMFVFSGSAAAVTPVNPCEPGTYWKLDACVDAPTGSFVAVYGAVDAERCQAGSYQDETGQTECKLAPVGTYVDFVGASDSTDCPEGFTTLGVGSTSGDQCDVPIDEPTQGELVRDAVRDGKRGQELATFIRSLR